MIGVERCGCDPSQPVGVDMDFDTVGHTARYAQRRVQLSERARDPFSVRPRRGRSHVKIKRPGDLGAVKFGCDSSDHHVVDLVPIEYRHDCFDLLDGHRGGRLLMRLMRW